MEKTKAKRFVSILIFVFSKQRQRLRIGVLYKTERCASLNLRWLNGGNIPVLIPVQIGKELISLELRIAEGHVGFFTVRNKELIDALTADDPEVFAVAVPQNAFQLVHVVADNSIPG